MLKEILDGVKVSPSIKPINRKDRQIPMLKLGHEYFISFLGHNAYPCTRVEIINEFDQTEVKVELRMKSPKGGFHDGSGMIRNYRTQNNIVYSTEIGITPQDAVKNQVG